jgi:hypothetical protein
MITAWDKLGIQGWAPLSQNCRIRALFACSLLHRKVWLKVSEKAGPRRDRSILEDSDDHGGIL